MSAADVIERTTQEAPRRHIGYQQAAELLSLPVGTLRSMVCRRQIPHIRISTRIVVFDVAMLKAWLAQHTVLVGAAS